MLGLVRTQLTENHSNFCMNVPGKGTLFSMIEEHNSN